MEDQLGKKDSLLQKANQHYLTALSEKDSIIGNQEVTVTCLIL